MRWAEDLFVCQFEPTDGGYLYYPGRRGGVFVSEAEYRTLLEGCRRSAGWSWKRISLLFGAVLVSVAMLFAMGDEADLVAAMAPVYAFMGWIVFDAVNSTTLRPRRLAAGRVEVVPPRSRAESRRLIVRGMPWWLIVGVLVVSAFALAGYVSPPSARWQDQGWAAFFALLFIGYAWLAVRKLRDR